MANIKISQLTNYTGSASGSYLVLNNPAETGTYKITREGLLSDYTSSKAISSSYATFASQSYLLDGYHASQFAKLNSVNTFTRDFEVVIGGIQSAGIYEGDTFFLLDLSDNSEIGLSNHLEHFISGSTAKAGLYVSSGSGFGDYRIAFEIHNGADFINPKGDFNILFPTAITGSLIVTEGITGSILADNGIISSSAQISQSGFVSSSTVQAIEVMTSASYAGITPVSGTLYVIIG